MSDSNIDRIPVNQLSARYNLARSAVYKRMADLGIEREKIGNRAYVSAEQVALLDELHSFINVGGNVAEFIARKGLDKPDSKGDSSGQASGQSSGLALSQADLVKVISAIAAEMTKNMQPALSASVDPLAYYESLEKAVQGGWKLRTSELSTLLKLSPKEIDRYNPSFKEAGFIFTRAGYRSGGETAWVVSKR